MKELDFERHALINCLYHAARLYEVASEADTDLKIMLVWLARERRKAADDFAVEWKFDPADDLVTSAELDDLERRIAASPEALAEVIELEERTIADIAEDLDARVLDEQVRRALIGSTRDVRQTLINALLMLRASADRSAGRNLGFALQRKGADSDGPVKPAAHLFSLWYATNREPVRRAGTIIGFSSARSGTTSYGTCDVTIPQTHKIGSVGSPWWDRIGRGDDRLQLGPIRQRRETDFWADVRARITRNAQPGDAVVFLHGYNVTFAAAAVRAAQIGADLSLGGAMAFFSWPSRGRLLGYTADEASIEASEHQITQFLIDFSAKSGARAVHVIAHSMGNRGLLRAVQRIAATAAAASAKPLGQIILAAPDVDSGTFQALATAYPAVAAQTTLYVSQSDMAVRSSRLLHGADRVGYSPPIAIVDGIDTVNVTGVDLSLLGHGYVGECRPVLYDMHEVLARGTAPHGRAMLHERADAGGNPYWEIAA